MVPEQPDPETPRPDLRVTTVRFDVELWQDFGMEAQRLGIPRSAYVRDAVREKVARAAYRSALAQLVARIERLEARMRESQCSTRRKPESA